MSMHHAGHWVEPSTLTVMLRGVCPRCGEGAMFSGDLAVAPTCSICGLELGNHDTGDGAVVLLIFLLGFVVVPPAILISMAVDWPLWVHAILWGAVLLLVTVGMLRPAKAFFVAQQYRHRRSELQS